MKVAIMGYSGSGKSTLAKMISEKNGISVLFLDCVHWLPGWQVREEEEKREMAEKISAENEKKLKQAKMLVSLVIILEVISTSLLNLVSLNFISIIVNVVFFILLWNGIPWVRYYYIYWAFSTVIVLIATTLFSDIVFPNILLVLIPCIIRLAGGLIFALNSTVKDFLYGQYAG